MHKDFAMCIDVNAYSAPPWRELTLKADLITVSLSERHMLIVTHLPSWQHKQRIELPTHEELVRKIHKKLWRNRQVALFAARRPAAREYLNALSKTHQPIRKNVQRLLSLSDPVRKLLAAVADRAGASPSGSRSGFILYHRKCVREHRHLPVIPQKTG